MFSTKSIEDTRTKEELLKALWELEMQYDELMQKASASVAKLVKEIEDGKRSRDGGKSSVNE